MDTPSRRAAPGSRQRAAVPCIAPPAPSDSRRDAHPRSGNPERTEARHKVPRPRQKPSTCSGSVSTCCPPPRFSVFERAGAHEGAALVDRRGIAGIERRRLRLDALALRIGRVARLETEVRGLRVIPPRARVVGHPESDGVAHLRREKRAAYQFHQVFVAEIGGEHAAILHGGKRKAEGQGHPPHAGGGGKEKRGSFPPKNFPPPKPPRGAPGRRLRRPGCFS